MNGSGENRYEKGFEKISKKLKLLYPCACCGENDYYKKEVHHIDEIKKNSKIENLVVLCRECHSLVHFKKQTIPEVNYKTNSVIVKISNEHNYINKNSKVDIIKIDSKTALEYRKQNVKGWIKPGSCSFYIGMIIDECLRGVLGFCNADFGAYDLLLKADTTNSEEKYSTDLLLYLLKTKKCKDLLEKKFNRNINSVYSTCFSRHCEINRYRKHGTKVKSVKTEDGFNISYLFEIGSIKTIKEAVSLFFQKHKDL
jgi:hypothetical protein